MTAEGTLQTISMAQAAAMKQYLTAIISTIWSTAICITRTMATVTITASLPSPRRVPC